MEWISVKDRLPEEREWILGYYKGTFYIMNYYPRRKENERDRQYCVGNWELNLCPCCDDPREPEFWMPLPKEPKE